MSETVMTSKWIDPPIVPDSDDDVATLRRLAGKARRRRVEFEWHLSPSLMQRLQEAVYSWGISVRGKYKAFDSQVLAAINDALGDHSTAYTLGAALESSDSHVEAARVEDGYRICGEATFDLLFGYARSARDPRHRPRLGDTLASALRHSIDSLGWDLDQLSRPDLAPVVNAFFGLPAAYGISEDSGVQPPTQELQLDIRGPLHWHRGPELPWLYEHPAGTKTGIYLLTVPIDGKEYVHYVGQTKRSFAGRLTEHLACYLSGRYSILDPEALALGRQKLIWKGARGTVEHGEMLTEFVDRSSAITPRLHALLKLLRVHLVPIADSGLFDRVEGALGRHFQGHPDDRIRRVFGVGARFPAAIPLQGRARCLLRSETAIAGLPSDLIV